MTLEKIINILIFLFTSCLFYDLCLRFVTVPLNNVIFNNLNSLYENIMCFIITPNHLLIINILILL